MKAALLLFSVLSVLVGSAVGATLGYRQYGQPANQFGPFSSTDPMSAEQIETYLASRRAAGSPKLEIVGGRTFDFGVMQRNAQASHDFTITNTGTAPLEMAVTGSTCKCTVGSLEQTSLQPGESTAVTLEWTAKTGSRTFSQSATLRTNDPEAGEVQLVVEGIVVDMIDAEPRLWNLGDVEASEPIELKTTLYNHADHPLEIVDARWMDDAFDALSDISYHSRPVDPAVDGSHVGALEAIDFVIRIAPEIGHGSLNHTLRINYRTQGETDSQPPLELTLNGRVVGALSLLGGSQLVGRETGNYHLRLGSTTVGQARSEKIHVVLRGPHRDSAQLSVGDVEPSEAIEAELGDPIRRGSMTLFPLEVRIRADAPQMQRTGTTKEDYGSVVIEADNAEIAPVRARVTFRVSDEPQ